MLSEEVCVTVVGLVGYKHLKFRVRVNHTSFFYRVLLPQLSPSST